MFRVDRWLRQLLIARTSVWLGMVDRRKAERFFVSVSTVSKVLVGCWSVLGGCIVWELSAVTLRFERLTSWH
jgi:hypothetical protein